MWGHVDTPPLCGRVCPSAAPPQFIWFYLKEEKTPDIAVLSFQDQELDVLLEEISYWAEKYQQIKAGEVEPERCGQCDYCKLTRVLAGPVDYREFLG